MKLKMFTLVIVLFVSVGSSAQNFEMPADPNQKIDTGLEAGIGVSFNPKVYGLKKSNKINAAIFKQDRQLASQPTLETSTVVDPNLQMVTSPAGAQTIY